MVLTDAQIERYSRQIIVPHLGGIRQELILRATMLLAGEPRDIEAPLAYLAGAGVGSIRLATPDGADCERLLASVKRLNPDVRVVPGAEVTGHVDVAFMLVGSRAARELASELASRKSIGGFVIARLDSAVVAVMPGKSPCPRCADGQLLAELGVRSDAADFISMVATVEALKLVAAYDENPAASVFEFHGYDSKTRAASASRGCACDIAG